MRRKLAIKPAKIFLRKRGFPVLTDTYKMQQLNQNVILIICFILFNNLFYLFKSFLILHQIKLKIKNPINV